MARNSQTQQLNIILNSEQARNQVELLEDKIKSLDAQIKRAKATGDSSLAQLQKQRRSFKQTLNQLTQDTRSYEKVLNNLNGSSIAQLERAYRALRREVRNTSPALDEFASKQKQLKLLHDRIQALNGQARQTESIFARVSDRFNRYFGMVSAGIASVTGISLAFRSAAQSAAEMDDIYSDVMKSTGLTREEVVELNEEFKKMDTRTSREELNRLAYEAGKLGIASKEDVLAFVRAADQINVALGEDLGEGAITNIGKIADVFGLTDSMGIERSLISIGSAINALGQDSTAAEAYLVEFTQRLAGVGAQSRMSVQDLLGYASPRVSLLSIGEEEGKGNSQVKEAYELLKLAQNLNFVGNAEGRDIFTGDIDVVVCDGFVGNVVVKMSEGLASALVRMLKRLFTSGFLPALGGMLAKGAFKKFATTIDYAEYGGAPLLGLQGLAIVCHGRSSARAMQNAIKMAGTFVRKGTNDRLAETILANEELTRFSRAI